MFWIWIRRIHKFLALPDMNPPMNKQKNEEKTLISTVSYFLLTCCLWSDVNVPTVRNKRKLWKNIFFVGILKATEERSGIRIRNFVNFFKYKNLSAPFT